MVLHLSVFEINGVPAAHISVDVRTFFWSVRRLCTLFQWFIIANIGGVHGLAAGHMLDDPVRMAYKIEP